MIAAILTAFSNASNATISHEKSIDVIGIGKALVDIIEVTSEEKLNEIMPKGFKKGDSTKINDLQAEIMLSKMQNYKIIPGGSEANVIVNVASLGGKSAFNAVVANDDFGILFKKSLQDHGVLFSNNFAPKNLGQTGRCFTFITPDKERTFAVAASLIKHIDDEYVNYDYIAKAKIFYTDASNLNNGGNQSKITLKAIDFAKNNNTQVAFNLNNNYYVQKNREEILKLLPKVDIFFASEKDAMSLFQAKDLEEALEKYRKYVKIAVITRGKDGALIVKGTQQIHVAAQADHTKIIDLNGAGDGFTGGFLYAYTQGYEIEKIGEIAAKTATAIIYQIGARPQESLKNIVLKNSRS